MSTGETFQPYSYGWLENLRKYGRITPPPYDLSKVTAPVYIYYGPNDLLVGPEVYNVFLILKHGIAILIKVYAY